MESLRVEVPGQPAGTYEVLLERGAFDRIGPLCAERAAAHAYALIADSRVAELYASRALDSLRKSGARAEAFVFPAGEWNKTRGSWAELTDAMLSEGYGRDTVVVALGGGVTGDLAGFVAATWMRGVPVVQVPTTVLAMVDSSVGGKTGVDTRDAKNAIGAFHHPSFVLVDPELLTTLVPFQRNAGLSESVKIAAMRDAPFFDWMQGAAGDLAAGDLDALSELIRRSVALKAEVVAEDPGEVGLRAILNFGHTAGHALEALSDFSLLHGEAVGQGMRLEARLGEAVGLTEPGTADRLDALLELCELTDEFDPDLSAGRILDAARADKKARQGSLRWSVPARIGEPTRNSEGGWTHAIDPAACEMALDAALRTASKVRDSPA